MIDPSRNWISLNRALKSHEIWLGETFTRGQAWVDLLMLAQWKDGSIRRRGVKIPVKRGQVTESQDTLSARWKWSKGKVQRFLKELMDDDRISNETVLKNLAISALITITNYRIYQQYSTEDGSVNSTEDGSVNSTEDGSVNSTSINKVNKVNKESREKFSIPNALMVQDYMLEIGFGGDGNQFINYYESKGWMVGKSKMKDWKASVRTWKTNGYGKGGQNKPVISDAAAAVKWQAQQKAQQLIEAYQKENA